MTGPRQRHYSGGPWEQRVGYCRATRVGDLVMTAGTTAMRGGELIGAGDAAVQTRTALQTIDEALGALGATRADVVRYRIYLTRIADWEAVAPVLGEHFGAVHPVNTLVEVSALIHPDMLVEIECDAIIGSATPIIEADELR